MGEGTGRGKHYPHGHRGYSIDQTGRHENRNKEDALMGCDIHMFVEEKVDGEWIPSAAEFRNEYYRSRLERARYVFRR